MPVGYLHIYRRAAERCQHTPLQGQLKSIMGVAIKWLAVGVAGGIQVVYVSENTGPGNLRKIVSMYGTRTVSTFMVNVGGILGPLVPGSANVGLVRRRWSYLDGQRKHDCA